MQPSQPRSSEFDRIELGKPLLDRLQEKFGWRIIPDGTAPLPTPSEKFDKIFPRPLEEIARLQRYYNDSVIIQDNFTSHVERKTFFNDILGERAGSWLKSHSKLAANNWYACLSHITEILDALKRKQVACNPAELNIDAVEARGRNGYNSNMTFEQKIEFVAQVDNLIFRFFSQLSKM